MGAQLDKHIGELAGRQHGVVSHAQLVALGVGRGAIRHREQTGRLHRLHRGVYAVGHTALSAKACWLAAVLALGPGAVLSHRSAAALHGLRPTSSPLPDVLVAGPGGRGHARVRVHRTVLLLAEEVTTVDAIPVTSWARTLLDLAAVVDEQGVRKALERAEELQLFDLAPLMAVLAAHRGHQGVGPLQRALVMYAPRAKSELQRRFLLLCERFGLPRPEEEAPLVGDHPVDFVWRRERLVVETDGWRFHRTRAAWARDREQDAQLVVAGYTVLRPTWDDVVVHDARTAGRIAHLLAAARPGLST